LGRIRESGNFVGKKGRGRELFSILLGVHHLSGIWANKIRNLQKKGGGGNGKHPHSSLRERKDREAFFCLWKPQKEREEGGEGKDLFLIRSDASKGPSPVKSGGERGREGLSSLGGKTLRDVLGG